MGERKKEEKAAAFYRFGLISEPSGEFAFTSNRRFGIIMAKPR